MALGERLKESRVNKGYSQGDVADFYIFQDNRFLNGKMAIVILTWIIW